MDRAKALAALDKKHIWHPFTQQTEWQKREPIIIESGRGVWLTDVRGRRFIDGASSLWVNVWGHNHPALNRAIRKQLRKVAHSTFLGLTHEPAIQLAKKLIEIAPKNPPGPDFATGGSKRRLSRVFYSDNGSTAVEVALKMAYQYWQLSGSPKKSKFVSLKDGYHGDTLGAVSVGGVDLFHERFKELLFEGWKAEFPSPGLRPPSPKKGEGTYPKTPSPFLGEGGGEGAGQFGDIAEIIRRHHREIAAVVMEPLIQGASGMLLLPKGYLAHVARLCKKYRVLLIVDEVATGFGRTGTMFAVEQESVVPDFLCLAKGLTGGYLPLAATLTTETIYRAFLGRYDEFKAFFHGHTYTANPLACAVALESLDLIHVKDLLGNVRRRTLQLESALYRLKSHPHVGEVRQLGLMAGILLTRDSKRPYPPAARMGLKACDAAFKKGVWLRPLGDVVVIMPPLVINEKELGMIMKVAGEAIEEVTDS